MRFSAEKRYACTAFLCYNGTRRLRAVLVFGRKKPMRFRNGVRDGIPVALGYLSVAFAYAIQAVGMGFPP